MHSQEHALAHHARNALASKNEEVLRKERKLLEIACVGSDADSMFVEALNVKPGGPLHLKRRFLEVLLFVTWEKREGAPIMII